MQAGELVDAGAVGLDFGDMVSRAVKLSYAERENVTAGVDKAADGAFVRPDAIFDMVGANLVGSRADGGHGVCGMIATDSLRSAPDGLGNCAVGGWRGQLIISAGPAMIKRRRQECAARADDFEDGVNYRLRSADDMADFRHAAMDHDGHAGGEAEIFEAGFDLSAADHLVGVDEIDIAQIAVGFEEEGDLFDGDLPTGFAGETVGDFGQIAAAVGPVERPVFETGAANSGGDFGRRIFQRGRKQCGASRDAAGFFADALAAPAGLRRRRLGCCGGGGASGVGELVFAVVEFGQEGGAIATPEPALESSEIFMQGVTDIIDALRRERSSGDLISFRGFCAAAAAAGGGG